MPTDLPRSRTSRKDERNAPRAAEFDWALAAVIIPLLLVVLTAALPFPLVLPAFAIITVAVGSAAGLIAYLGRTRSKVAAQQVRDAAGVLLLIGFGASMLTDVGGALAALGEFDSHYRSASSNSA